LVLVGDPRACKTGEVSKCTLKTWEEEEEEEEEEEVSAAEEASSAADTRGRFLAVGCVSRVQEEAKVFDSP
jgi:hypothetical protein